MLSKTIYVIVCNGVPVVAFEDHLVAEVELRKRSDTQGITFSLEPCDLELMVDKNVKTEN